MAKNVEKELITATGVKPKEGKSRNHFLERLVTAVAELDEAGWNGLSTAAQSWYNAAADAVAAGTTLPDFTAAKKDTVVEGAALPGGDEGDENVDAEPPPETDAVDDAKPKKSGKSKSKAKTKTPAAADPKPDPVPDPKPARKKKGGSSAVTTLRQLTIRNPEWDRGRMISEMNKRGFEGALRPTTLSTLFYDTRTILNMAKSDGWSPPKSK